MLKRIQSLFIILSIILMGTTLFAEFCFVMAPKHLGEDIVREVIRFTDKQQYVVFALTSVVLSILTLLYFKSYNMQIRLSTLNCILLFAFQIWIAVDFFQLYKVYNFNLVSLFPLITIILQYLAIRYIYRDQVIGYVYSLAKKTKSGKK